VGVHWGLIGLSLASLVWPPLVFMFGMNQGLPVLGLRTSALLNAMLRPAAAGLIMTAAVMLARILLTPGISGAWMLAGLVLVGAMTYLVSSLLLNREGMREAMSLVANMIASRSPAEDEH